MSKFVGGPDDVAGLENAFAAAPCPCPDCAHYLEGWTCAAFPAGIPEIIVQGLHQHREPLAGDSGIQFKQAEAQATE